MLLSIEKKDTISDVYISIIQRDLADAKTDIIRWVAGLLMAQAAIIAALV